MLRGLLAVLVAAVPLALAAPAAASATPSAAERELVREINRVRKAHKLPSLKIDPVLHRAARSHSRDMLKRDYFAHGDFGARMQRFKATGPRLGENLAWGSGSHGTAARFVQMWLKSPGHRANLLRPGYRRIGVGIAAGTFSGAPGATIATANFAGS
jgi:uncharacterized protein YkwD